MEVGGLGERRESNTSSHRAKMHVSFAVCLNWKERVGVMEADQRKQEVMGIQQERAKCQLSYYNDASFDIFHFTTSGRPECEFAFQPHIAASTRKRSCNHTRDKIRACNVL